MTFDSTQLVPGAEDVNRAILDLLDKVNRRLDNLESITTKTVNATTIKADTVQAQTVTTQDLSATNADIDNLTADSGAFATSLTLGGYPVVESGSNANGNWTKWADGTMICWFNTTADRTPVVNASIGTFGWSYYGSGTSTWTFPVAFTANVGCWGRARNRSMGVSFGAPTLTNVAWNEAGASSEATNDITLYAIGRWL